MCLSGGEKTLDINFPHRCDDRSRQHPELRNKPLKFCKHPKLKFQYFGLLMRRVDSLEKTLELGKIEGRRIRG